MHCWGEGTRDQLGTGQSVDALEPVVIPGLQASAVARAPEGGCAIRNDDRRVLCWGDNLFLGNGDNSTSLAMDVPLACR